MATISKINGATDPQLMAKVANTTRPQGDVVLRRAPIDEKVIKEILESPQNSDKTIKTMNLKRIEGISAQLQASIDRVSNNQHQVGFHKDPRTNNFIIEIKNVDGSVIKQFPPEKVLNLMQRLDDLSGMVIDTMT